MRSFFAVVALTAAAFIALNEFPGRVSAQQPLTQADREVLHEEIRAYLLENPGILREMIALLEAEVQAGSMASDPELLAEHGAALFDDGYSYVGGNPEGSFTIVEFLDHQCGYCRRAHPEMVELLDADGDIRWVIKEMPILGPGSVLASRAAIAGMIAEGPETYRGLVDRFQLMQGRIDETVVEEAIASIAADPAAVRAAMDDPEVERRIADTRSLAEKMGFNGTPAFVFDDLIVRGYLPLAQMERVVADRRAAR